MSKFKPLNSEQLRQVDIASCTYGVEFVEIEGVVSPSGQGGWPKSGDYSVHCFSFSAWRRPGQQIVRQKLTVLRPVDPESDYLRDYPKLSIQRFQLLLSTDETRAIFAGLSLGAPNPSGLQEVVDELEQPVIIESARFGELVLDRSIDWFTGDTEWNGEEIELSFHTGGSLDITTGLAVAEQLWQDQQAWKAKVDQFAIQELLSLKNDNWLGDDEQPLAAEDFLARMTLNSISIDPEGNFEFWHDDGDLFWGHSIQISGSLAGLTRADIPG